MSDATSSRKCVAFRVPANLPADLFTPDELQYAHYLLNLIWWRSENGRADRRGYVRLHKDVLEAIVPTRRLYTIKDVLAAHAIIEVDNVYVRGHRSKGYRINPQYAETVEVVCGNDRLADKIRAQRERARESRMKPVHYWLRGNLALLRLDKDRALGMCQNSKDPVDMNKKVLSAWHDLSWLAVCRYGRVHSALTCMLSEPMRRQCLSVDGERLVELDLACSQPLFLGLLVSSNRQPTSTRQTTHPRVGKDVLHFPDSASGLRNETQPNSPTNHHPIPTHPLDMVKDVLHFPDTQSDSGGLTRYLRDCEDGSVYDKVAPRGMSRRDSKHAFMLAMFGATGYAYKGEWWERFGKRYPAVGTWIVHRKSANHAAVAHRLQRAESDLFIGAVCERIRVERPETFLATVHDSVLVRPADAAYVKGVIEEELAKLGLKGTIRQKGESK